MLTCREVTELVTDYLEGDLSFRRWASLQLHLGMCVRCRLYLRQRKLVIRSLRMLPAQEVPDDVVEDTVRRLAGWKRE